MSRKDATGMAGGLPMSLAQSSRAGESIWLFDIARILRERMGSAASKVSTKTLPNWLVRLGTRKNPKMKDILPMLSVNMNATSEKARRLLGWNPRPVEEAVVATAESLLRLKLVEA